MSIGLSVSWNAFRYEDAEAMLAEVLALGFKEIELSFNLTVSQVEVIAAYLGPHGISVRSLHNYCPIPDGLARKVALPDCYSLSSLDEEERSLAVRFTKRSIDTAERLSAQAVVLHCGRVEIPDRMRDLVNLYEKGLKDSQEFRQLRQDIIRQRKETKGKFFEQALRSIDELERYARRKNISLGIETRFYYREIPEFEEIGIILEKFRGSKVCYWHDTGHAQVMELLGFMRHEDFLEAYSGSLGGIHIHDALGCDDHRAPGKGEIDFLKLKPYIKKDTIKVIEAHHPATGDDLKSAKKLIEGIFDA